jgi:hypothetical protein
VLDRSNGRRAFRRVLEAEATDLLSGERPRRRGAKDAGDQPGADEPSPAAGTEGANSSPSL